MPRLSSEIYQEYNEQPETDDGLDAARGIAVGIVLSIALIVGVTWLVFACV